MLGNRYVNITRGFTGSAAEDKIRKCREPTNRRVDVLSSMQGMTSDVQEVIRSLQAGKGSVGKLLTDDQPTTI